MKRFASRSLWVVLGMDPDTAWQEMRKAFVEISDVMGSSNHYQIFSRNSLEKLEEQAHRLSEHAADMRQWVSRGGFLPADVSG